MPFALSTQGQGSTSFIAVPSWSRPASADWMAGITCKIFDLSVNQHILGRSGSTAGSLRVLTDGALRYRDGSADLITSAAGLVATDTYFTAVVRRTGSVIELWVGPEAMDETLSGGTKIGETTTLTSTVFNGLNQIGRFATTARNDIEVKKFWTIGGTYTDEADGTTSVSSGVDWPFASASRNLTITNATGSADSWWVSYGGAINQLSATLSSASSLSAGLTAVNRMAVSLQSISALNANLTVGTPVTNLAATLSSASALAATLTVANRMSASLASSSAVSATLTAKHKLSASLQSVSSISASLTLTSGSVVFPIDVAGIPDGTYPVALFNHETGDFVSRTNVTFVSGSAEVASVLPVGTEFSGYVIETGATPTVGAVVYGQVAYAS